jgi:outer membrane lipoprotein
LIVRRLSMLALLLPLAACIKPPEPLRGAYPPLTVTGALQPGTTGERVRWGGEIASTTPRNGETCFEVVSKPLDDRARPMVTDQTDGRFVACTSGFEDPDVYAPGRDITVVGSLEAPTPGKVGEAEYSFATVRADTVYLWPQREPRDGYPYWGYPYWGWGWGWGGPVWGWGGGGVFVGRRIGGRWH